MNTPQHHLGDLLQAARERRYLSLQQAAAATHIRALYLDAIEQGRPDLLPGAAYGRGYVRRYALYLGVNEAEALALFDKIGLREERRFLNFPQVSNKEREPSKWLIYSTLTVAAFVSGGWMALEKAQHKASVAHIPYPAGYAPPKPVKCTENVTALPCYWRLKEPYRQFLFSPHYVNKPEKTETFGLPWPKKPPYK